MPLTLVRSSPSPEVAVSRELLVELLEDFEFVVGEWDRCAPAQSAGRVIVMLRALNEYKFTLAELETRHAAE